MGYNRDQTHVRDDVLKKNAHVSCLKCYPKDDPFPSLKFFRKREWQLTLEGEEGCMLTLLGLRMEVDLYYWLLKPLIRMCDVHTKI
jgi:hypothetical protein